MVAWSTDVSVIHDASPSHTDSWAVEWGLPIYLPMIEINTIGSGAGSLIAVDDVQKLFLLGHGDGFRVQNGKNRHAAIEAGRLPSTHSDPPIPGLLNPEPSGI